MPDCETDEITKIVIYELRSLAASRTGHTLDYSRGYQVGPCVHWILYGRYHASDYTAVWSITARESDVTVDVSYSMRAIEFGSKFGSKHTATPYTDQNLFDLIWDFIESQN